MHGTGKRIYEFLSGYAFAITLLAFLLLLTFLGTIEQTQAGLFDVQRRYFESVVVWHHIGPVAVPLPGAYLLLVLLAVNLVLGGIVRIRKDRTTLGILVVHLGIIVMLGGSLVEYQYSRKGHTTLLEGNSSDEFQSYHEWEIAIAEGDVRGAVKEYVIPGEQWIGLEEGDHALFHQADLPFDLEVHEAVANCQIVPAVQAPKGAKVVDGFALDPKAPERENERNVAGARVTVVDKATGARQDGLLWAFERAPLSVVAGGKRWTVTLSRRRWALPFDVKLVDFRRVLHPGTGMAKSFESDVVTREGEVEQQIKISMNEPLRHQGVTLYQSGFGEPRPGSGGRFTSTFAVVENPADQIPLISCLIIALGLVMHFSRKLVRHVRSEARSSR